MNCPWCDHEATPRELHAHLLDRHGDRVAVDDDDSRRTYSIDCPLCGAGYSQPIEHRRRDPGFLEEFDREIRLVTFDMLVSHLLAEHEVREVALPEVRAHGGHRDQRP